MTILAQFILVVSMEISIVGAGLAGSMDFVFGSRKNFEPQKR